MTTVGKEPSGASAHAYIRLYTYVMLYCAHTVYIYIYILGMRKRKEAPLLGPHIQHFNYIMRPITLHKISRMYIHFF
jgi:hypothetical protein